MTKSSVQVFLRSRPSAVPNPNVNCLSDGKTVVISVPKDHKATGAQGNAGTQYQFKFDGVLHEASQEDVFEATAVDVLRSAMDGCNSTMMCYGQTGAGKTYTMSGGRQSYKQRGLIPRVLTALFAEVKNRPLQETRVSISYLEIYNEQLYDLLDITTQPHEINVQDISSSRQGAGSGIKVTGLKTVSVDTEAEAMKLLFEGETNRVIGEHQLNRESSRSHSIFQISLEMRTRNDPMGVMVMSKLSLVDLAGSERVSKTRSEGTVLKEAGHINKSLSILEQVILALSEKGRDHVPFRSSRLTHVLKDSLGGNCVTVLLANVWGDPDQIEETVSTCRFAQRMMKVMCEVTPNVVEDNSAKVRQLQRQVNELQQELAMHDSMAGRQGVSYAPYTAQQRAMLAAQLDLFLEHEDPESLEPLELMNLRHVREVLFSLRSRVKDKLAEADRAIASAREAAAGLAAAATAAAGGEPLSPTSAMVARIAAPEGVGPSNAGSGEGDRGGEGAAQATGGVSGAEAGSTNQDQSATEQGGGAGGAMASSSSSSPAAGGLSKPGKSGPGRPGKDGPISDRQAGFLEFKSGDGAAKHALLDENKTRLKTAKKKAKELGLAINSAKRELDSLKSQSDALKASRQARGGDAAQVLDPEELDVLNRIKQYKKQYKDQFGELQMVRSEVDYTQQLCDTCSKEILTDFQQWYLNMYGITLASDSLPAPSGIDAFDDAPPSPSNASQSAASNAWEVASSAGSSAAPSSSSVITSGSVASLGPAGLIRPHPGQPKYGQGRTAGIPKSGTGVQGGAPPVPRRKPGAVSAAVVSSSVSSGPGAPLVPTGPAAAAAAARLPTLPPPPQPEPGELNDPEAHAFYQAQQAMLARTQGVLHRPGSVKKKVGPDTTFSHTNRADITAKVSPDVFVKPIVRNQPH